MARVGTDAFVRPSPSAAWQPLHRGQLRFRHHDPGKLARPRFLADYDLDIAIQSIEKMQQALDGKTVQMIPLGAGMGSPCARMPSK